MKKLQNPMIYPVSVVLIENRRKDRDERGNFAAVLKDLSRRFIDFII